MFNEATAQPFFDEHNQKRELMFWRNLRKNNMRTNEDYEYVTRTDNEFVFINVGTLFWCFS